MDDLSRSDFLKMISAGITASLLAPAGAAMASPPSGIATEVNIIIPKEYRPEIDESSSKRLQRAVLETLQRHYGSQNMPVWKRPFDAVDMEIRIHWISHWLMIAIKQHERVYPVDPALIMAMIMKESYFHEYAISAALAVGICQFVQPTAQEYQMLCAGTKAEHGRHPYLLPEYAGMVSEYYRLRQQRRRYRRDNRPAKRLSLKEALAVISEQQCPSHGQEAGRYLAYLKALDDFDQQRRQSRDRFRQYLEANVAQRNLFDRGDLAFLLSFDERFTYKKPLSGMVLMLARHLRARRGNVLAAVVGYNAGLSTTRDIGRFEPYGRVPYIRESTEYISHVLVNHHEITSRM